MLMRALHRRLLTIDNIGSRRGAAEMTRATKGIPNLSPIINESTKIEKTITIVCRQSIPTWWISIHVMKACLAGCRSLDDPPSVEPDARNVLIGLISIT